MLLNFGDSLRTGALYNPKTPTSYISGENQESSRLLDFNFYIMLFCEYIDKQVLLKSYYDGITSHNLKTIFFLKASLIGFDVN